MRQPELIIRILHDPNERWINLLVTTQGTYKEKSVTQLEEPENSAYAGLCQLIDFLKLGCQKAKKDFFFHYNGELRVSIPYSETLDKQKEPS